VSWRRCPALCAVTRLQAHWRMLSISIGPLALPSPPPLLALAAWVAAN
jgi:hypothetical protein